LGLLKVPKDEKKTAKSKRLGSQMLKTVSSINFATDLYTQAPIPQSSLSTRQKNLLKKLKQKVSAFERAQNFSSSGDDDSSSVKQINFEIERPNERAQKLVRV
jgi:hypothetical protein